MNNELRGFGDEAGNFLTREDETARMRDQAAVNMARQVHEWAKDNLNRFDDDGNERVNFGELDLGKRTAASAADARALQFLQDNYSSIQDQSQNRFLFIKGRGGVSINGIGDYVKRLEEQQAENEQALQAKLNERSLQAQSRNLAGDLLSTASGNPNQSLFRVIDSLDGKIHHEVDKGDLKRYLEEYQKRARYGDIGSGYFTPETRRYVEQLKNNWDSESMRRLRGTYTTRDHDGRDREVANGDISEKSLKSALGMSKHADMFAPFVAGRAAGEPIVRAQSASRASDVVIDSPQEQPSADSVVEAPAAVRQPARVQQPAAEKSAVLEALPKAAEKPAQTQPAVAEKPAVQTQPEVADKPVVQSKRRIPEKPVAETPVQSTEKPAERQVVAKPVDGKTAETAIKSDDHMAVASNVAGRIKNDFFRTEQLYAAADAEQASADRTRLDQAHELNEWSKDNLRRFDTTGDNKVNYGELDLGVRTTSAPDQGMLRRLHTDVMVPARKDTISLKDVQTQVERAQEILAQNEAARRAAFDTRQSRAVTSHLAAGLFASVDGNPNRSLFRVVDGLDNDIDHEISRRDLRRYLDQYEQRSRYGDVGRGYFSQQTRRYVEFLNNNWDTPDVVRLRGTYRGHDDRTETYGNISLERLSRTLGLSRREDLFRLYSFENR